MEGQMLIIKFRICPITWYILLEVIEDQGESLFKRMRDPSHCLHHLLPPVGDISVTETITETEIIDPALTETETETMLIYETEIIQKRK